MPHYKDPAGKPHYLDNSEFVHLLPEGSIEITAEEAAALVAPSHNEAIDTQIVAIEQANPISHRTMREFIIGVSTGIAAAQGVTPSQLMDTNDPHYSHAYAAFVGVNQQTVALRAQKSK